MFSGEDLFRLLWPLLTEQLLAVFVGMADTLMVSTVGEAAVSGVSLVDSITIFIIQSLFGLTAGGSVVCARYIGKKDMKRASRSGGQMLLITVGASLLVTLILLFGGRLILRGIFGKVEEAVMTSAATYLFITCLSFPFLAVYNSCAAIFRANKITKLSLYVSLFMNVLNLTGNAICIFGLKMGVEGVAIPTLISRTVAAVIMLYFLQKPDNELRIPDIRHLHPDTDMIGRICAIGIPSSVEGSIFQFGKLMLQSLVSTLGTASIAAYAVASNLVMFLYLPGNSLGAGLLTIVGQCIGAGEKKQARNYTKQLMILNYMMLAVIGSILFFGRDMIVGWYHLEATSSALAKEMVMIHVIAMVIWPLSFLIPYYFRASGKAAFTMKISIFSMWVFRVALAYVFVLVLHMNVVSIWYAMFCDWIFRSCIFVYYFFIKREEEQPAQVSSQ